MHCKLQLQAGLWSRKSRHPTPTPGNFDYPTPTPQNAIKQKVQNAIKQKLVF